MEGKRFSLQSFSEDEFGKKLDRCLTDTLIKGGKYSWLYNMNVSSKQVVCPSKFGENHYVTNILQLFVALI